MPEAMFGRNENNRELTARQFCAKTYDRVAELCVRSGFAEVNMGAVGPEEGLDPLEFRYNLDPTTVKAALFSNNPDITLDPNGCYFVYLTPHALIDSDGEPGGSIMLNASGKLYGAIDFEEYLVITRTETSDDDYNGEVVTEYRQHGRYIDKDILMAGEPALCMIDDLIAIESGVRPLHPDDFVGIHRLLRAIETP